MILREIRRFIKNSPLLSSAGIIVMTLGFSASALSFTLLLAFTTLHSSGMKDVSYATLSEQVVDGGSSPISWERYTQLEKTQMPGIAFTAYSLPISAELGAYGYRKSIHLAAVSGSLFSMLEEPLLAGRYFNLNEEQSHEAHQIILTARLARELFGQPSQALEKIIVINDRPFEVIGIAPGSFQGVFGNVTDAWVPPNSVIPLMLNVPTDKSRADVWKLIPAFFALACAEHLSSHSLSQRLQRPALLKHAGDADLHVSEGLTADPQRDEKLRRWSRLGMMLAIFFTLVSSLDFCLLLLAKAPTYMEEATIKKALGAPQRRLLVELMIGPLVAMSFSLCASVLLVVGGLHQISRLSPFYEQSLRGATHALTLALASQIVFSGLLILAIALVPALYIVANDGAPRSGHTTTASRRMDVLMQIPVVLQIACCITTCILAGMIVSSLLEILKRPLGYVETNLKVVNIAPVDKLVQFSTGSGGTSPEAFALGHVMEALKNIPGVSQVSYVSNAPFSDTSTATQKMQRSDDAGSAPRTVGSISITPGYFKTVGTRILAGSDYSIDQSAGQGSEIIVNALLVKELFARESPIGKGVKISVPAWSGMTAFSYRATIIGVVENSRQFGLASSPQLTFYTSIIGTPFMDVRPQLVVSGIVSEGELRAAASRIVPGFMSGMGVSDVYGVAPLITTALAPEVQRVYWALGGAVIMSVMAYTGLLGALAYYVRSKQRDLAVRICLGANPRSIRTIVVIRALKCTLPASLLAIPFALMLRQLSSTDLLGQSAWSTPQAVSIAVTCVFVSGIVSVIPARAATRISPAEILKT